MATYSGYDFTINDEYPSIDFDIGSNTKTPENLKQALEEFMKLGVKLTIGTKDSIEEHRGLYVSTLHFRSRLELEAATKKLLSSKAGEHLKM